MFRFNYLIFMCFHILCFLLYIYVFVLLVIFELILCEGRKMLNWRRGCDGILVTTIQMTCDKFQHINNHNRSTWHALKISYKYMQPSIIVQFNIGLIHVNMSYYLNKSLDTFLMFSLSNYGTSTWALISMTFGFMLKLTSAKWNSKKYLLTKIKMETMVEDILQNMNFLLVN